MRMEPPDPALLDAIQQPVWTVLPDGTVAYANRFWQAYTGLSAEQAVGNGWATAVHPDDVPAILDRWNEASQHGDAYEIEYRFRRSDGRYRWHLARVAPISDADGGVSSWVGVGIDIDDRRRARNALLASEARYRNVVTTADDIIYTAELDGTVVDVNPAVERKLGYRPDDLIGRSFETLLTPRHLELSRRMLAHKLEGAESSTYELDVLAKAGHRVALEINTRLVTTEEGTLIHGIARDVSARRRRLRQAELGAAVGAALTGQQPLYDQLQACAQAIVDHLDVAIAQVWTVAAEAPDQLVLRASAGMDRPLGGDAPHRDVRLYPMIQRIAAERQPLLTTDLGDDPAFGDQAWLEREGILAFAGYPLLVGPQRVGALAVLARRPLETMLLPTLKSTVDAIAVAIDRGHAQRAREATLERERAARTWAEDAETRYRSLFEGVGDAVLVADDDRRYRDANAAATHLLGYRREELLQLRIEDVVVGGSAWTEAEFTRYLEEGRWHGELELRRKDGSVVPAEAVATIVQLPGGPVYLSALRDITQRRHLARLERDFLAMVTHDLRTPIAAIKGWLQLLLRRDSLAEREQGTVQSALGQVERASHLIDDLADLVRIEAGHLELGREAVDLLPLVEEQVALLQAQTQDHVLRIEAARRPITGMWDRQRLGQVVQNLLSNAIKYSPDGGEIVVQLATDGERARLQVADPGIGIAAEQRTMLFERFYRAGASGAGGLGLGLHITKMLVDAHGGSIAVESALGQGSTFTVILPLGAGAADGDGPEH